MTENEGEARAAATRKIASDMQAHYQYELGPLMEDLRKHPEDCPVLLEGWPGPERGVAAPHCYRGNPAELALQPVHSLLSVVSVYDMLLAVLGTYLPDRVGARYKPRRNLMPPAPEQYPMMRHTRVWISRPEEVSRYYPCRISFGVNNGVHLHLQERIDP